MGGLGLTLRAGLRLRWRALLGLAVLLGLMGGIALTAAAGARRTDTAYQRLLQQSNASDLLVSSARSGFDGYFTALTGLRQVASMSTTAYLDMTVQAPGGPPDTNVVVQASPDGAAGLSVDRVKVVSGRPFNTADPRAVMIDQALAARERLRPGSTLRMIGYPQKNGSADFAHAAHLDFVVSAVVVFDDQVVPATREIAVPTALLSPAFARTPAARSFNPGGGSANVVLRPGTNTAATFTEKARTLAARYQIGGVQIVNLATNVAATERAIRPETVALAIFAALAGLIALAVIAQLLSRQLVLDAAAFPVLRALGMTRARLAALSLVQVAAVTAAGATIAVAVAISLSPLMPIGPARLAEPSPGIEVNLAILAAGFAAIAALPLALVAPTAWRASAWAQGPLGGAEPPVAARASRLGPALGTAGSVTGSLGVRMAFEPGRGRTAVPVRSALIGTTVAVAAVVAALVFGTSFIGLVSTPHRYGQNWTQELDLQVGAIPITVGTKVLSTMPGLADDAAGNYGQLVVGRGADGTTLPAIGLDQLRGHGFLTLLAGRPPAGPHEIVLGERTLRALRLRVGQNVPVTANGKTAQMRVVGAAVFAAFSVGGGSATDLGYGAAVSASVLSAPSPPNCVGGATCYNFFLLRYRSDTDLAAAAARLESAVSRAGCPPGLCLVTTDQRPGDIQNYTGVRETPLVLGAVLALLAIGTLTHVLLTGVSRRRRDLAVLKTLGLTRSQLIGVVFWQASALTATSLIAGLPLGVLAGRWSWALFAGSVGTAGYADVPVRLLLLGIPATLLLANLIAAGPGWAAARIRPAHILRSE